MRFVEVIFIYIYISLVSLVVNCARRSTAVTARDRRKIHRIWLTDQPMTRLNLWSGFFFFFVQRIRIKWIPSRLQLLFIIVTHKTQPHIQKRTIFIQLRTQPNYSSFNGKCLPIPGEDHLPDHYRLGHIFRLMLGNRRSFDLDHPLMYRHPEFQKKNATTTLLSDLSLRECCILSSWPSISS